MLRLFIYIALLTAPLGAFAASVKVIVPDGPIEPFDPLTATIEVLHSPEEKVDENSFILEGESLKVQRLEEATQPDKQVLSKYAFDIAPEKEGLSALAAISVKVGDKRIEAPPVTYTVQYATPKTGLKLRAFVLGEEPFYPGKRLKFVYKIYYRGDVQLTKEDLPLIKAEGFTKIGELNVKDSKYKGYSVSIITQEVEAKAPGDYSFGAATLEGLINNKEKVTTTVKPFTITIAEFPQKTKPPTFTGGIGSFKVSSRLISTPKVKIGDILLLEITFSGTGNLDNIKLPKITCEPGLSGFFAPTQTPPYAKTENNSKIFTIELAILSPLAQEIPKLTFSMFNPETQKYEEIQTDPIPLEISPSPLPKLKRPPLTLTAPVDWNKLDVSYPNVPLQQAIYGSRGIHPGLARFYGLIILGLLAWGLLYFFKDLLTSALTKKKTAAPQDRLKKALQYPLDNPEFFRLIRQPFESDSSPKTKQFLRYLDNIQFGGKQADKKEIYKKALEALK